MRVAVPPDTEAIVVKWCWDLKRHDTGMLSARGRKYAGIGRNGGIQSMAQFGKHNPVPVRPQQLAGKPLKFGAFADLAVSTSVRPGISASSSLQLIASSEVE